MTIDAKKSFHELAEKVNTIVVKEVPLNTQEMNVLENEILKVEGEPVGSAELLTINIIGVNQSESADLTVSYTNYIKPHKGDLPVEAENFEDALSTLSPDAQKYIRLLKEDLAKFNKNNNYDLAKYYYDTEMKRYTIQSTANIVGGLILQLLKIPNLVSVALNVAAVLSTRRHLQQLRWVEEFMENYKEYVENKEPYNGILAKLKYIIEQKAAKAERRTFACIPEAGTIQQIMLKANGVNKVIKETKGVKRLEAATLLKGFAKAGMQEHLSEQPPEATAAQLIILSLVGCRAEGLYTLETGERYKAVLFSPKGEKLLAEKMKSF
ncbi:hypothetical protein PSCICN_34120 [Pseudomonas cichorii]|uniref:hypothetical protein n=1 Tax=Pseudomonas cichorii TaxID=36746 RepID=UPI001910BC0F|nr:hypothetical protein [Pseudomonas cichorii]GFM82720.1 hypothetical protein PSCICN_34120 [Pseudomonas cichorii]